MTTTRSLLQLAAAMAVASLAACGPEDTDEQGSPIDEASNESTATAAGAQGSSCFTDGQCTPPLICSSVMRSCQPKAPIGGQCGTDHDCTSNVCNSWTRTCGPSPDGTSCLEDRACRSGICSQYTHRCSTPSSFGNDPCARNLECGSNLCITASHRCYGYQYTCNADTECPAASGLVAVCNASHKCGQGWTGAMCNRDIECLSGLYCDMSWHSCTMLKSRGAPCTANNQCASHQCASGQCW